MKEILIQLAVQMLIKVGIETIWMIIKPNVKKHISKITDRTNE